MAAVCRKPSRPKKSGCTAETAKDKVIRSAEEEVLQVIMACPQCKSMLNEDNFQHRTQ